MERFDNKVFVFNKDKGPTSFEVVRAFRRATGLKRVGHTGTLDPMAKGVLILCTGRATRAVEHFMDLPKTYEYEIMLGVETDTLDADGKVMREVPCPALSEADIVSAAEDFVGEYELCPPAYSALKHDGRRHYDIARAGETPELKKRDVKIYEMQVLGISLPRVSFRVKCSRGTYVRSLARDFGARFELPAHVASLTRTAVGDFRVDGAIPCRSVFDENVADVNGLPLADALDFLPGVVIRDSWKKFLMDGHAPLEREVVRMIGSAEAGNALRILDEAGELLAVGNSILRAPSPLRPMVDSFRLFVDRESLGA